MKWVTRKGAKFDRSACAWLILRFIDPEAEFGFLTADEMPAAIAAGAQAFHNYAYTGSQATLPADRVNLRQLIINQGLDQADPALLIFADSVKEGERAGWAKTGAENSGLWAIGNGVSSLSGGDDATFVRNMLPIYDALYEYARLRAAGGHGWASDS